MGTQPLQAAAGSLEREGVRSTGRGSSDMVSAISIPLADEWENPGHAIESREIIMTMVESPSREGKDPP